MLAEDKIQNGTPAPQIQDDHGFAPNLTYAGIFVGLVLAGLGGITIVFSDRVPMALCALTMCIGFGIVLAAFGSRAAGKWGGFAVVGSAGLAIILFLLLEYFLPTGPDTFFKRALVSGDFSKVAEFQISDEEPLYMRRDKNTGFRRFIILGPKFEAPVVSVQVDTTEKGDGKEFFTMVARSAAIAQRYFSTSGVIAWSFDYNHRQIRDGKDIIFSSPKDLDESILRPATNRDHSSSLIEKIFSGSVAFAEDLPPSGYDTLIRQLRDDDAAIRRNARDALARAGVSAIAPMMQAFHVGKDNYRTKLGVTFSLNSMLKGRLDTRPAISQALTTSDLGLLQAATADEDPTTRLLATEFLYRLGDKRSIDFAIKNVSSPTSSETSKSNSALIIKGVFPNLEPTEKKRVGAELNAVQNPLGSKTSTILKSIRIPFEN